MDDLVKKARRGDPDAFTLLIQSQMQHMYKIAWSLLRNDEDAGDAMSETILKCWEKLEQLREDRFFRTWLTRILINQCKDILSRRNADGCLVEEVEIAANENGFENAEWRAALSRLDDKYSLIMILYYVEDFSTAEIGELLDMPESTVRTRLARGRESLAKAAGAERRKK